MEKRTGKALTKLRRLSRLSGSVEATNLRRDEVFPASIVSSLIVFNEIRHCSGGVPLSLGTLISGEILCKVTELHLQSGVNFISKHTLIRERSNLKILLQTNTTQQFYASFCQLVHYWEGPYECALTFPHRSSCDR